MPITGEEQGQEQYVRGRESNPLPWIQKYLELADLLIRRGRYARSVEQHETVRPGRQIRLERRSRPSETRPPFSLAAQARANSQSANPPICRWYCLP